VSGPGASPGAAREPRPAATTPAARRLGILGGTFDPPHLAHLAVAEEAREALGLERVLFVPAGRPWQKVDRSVTPGPVRLAMVERAIAGNRAFAVDRREIDRPGPTYTADTLAELAAAEPAGTELWLILSAEALAGLATWHEPDRVLALAHLCVAPRGVEHDAGTAAAAFRAAFPAAADRLVALDRPRLGISSTEIRDRVRAGRSIRYLVPDGVAELVTRYALYRPDAAPPAPATDA
jgi:nicotinate-nucleotide adenylyltransferase